MSHCIVTEMKQNSNIESRFLQLLEKFQESECSLAELYELETFFEQEKSAVALKKQMIQELNDQKYLSAEDFFNEQTFQKIKKQIHSSQQKSTERVRSMYVQVARIAAIVVFSFVLGGVAFNFITPKPQVEAVSYCEVTTPLGARSTVVLPDSSTVFLNAGSKIRYSTNFNKEERNVSLIGEGFFEVAKNKELPFKVNALGFIVEAVGTEFNVHAYEEEQTIETILVEGKVKLGHQTEHIAENVFLNPNSKATFYKESEVARKSGHPRLVISTNIDARSLVSWKDDQLNFTSEKLNDLVVKLGRKYDYTFLFKSDEVRNFRFTGSLEGETLQEVMDVIKTTSPISYEIKGKVVIIDKDLNRTKNFK